MSLLMLMAVAPAPAFDSQFLSGVLPAGLTYTNSSTTRTYFGADGLLKTAAADAPIFEYNPVTLALFGMRWEMEQRTNLALQSVFPGSGVAPTGWSGGGVGISGPAASIYGTADGSQAWTQTATANRPFIAQTSSSLSANTTYTLSVLIETVSASIQAENMIGAIGLPAGASVSYPACTANPSGGASGIIGVGSLEVRIAIAGTAGTISARIGLGVSANSTGTVKFSRPQLEAGASRSSFIPTTTAAVTRQPDVLAASSIPWYRQDEGTVLFEGITNDISATLRGIFSFSDGTNANRIYAYATSGSVVCEMVVSSATLCSIASGTISAVGTVFRTGFGYKTNSFYGSTNGAAGASDISGALPTVSALRLGTNRPDGVNGFMGYARRFQYFNTRLPNSQIQGMSRV